MYEVNLLVQGFPGRAVCHGGLGWSTVTLLRGEGRIILVDVGGFAVRLELARQLKQHGVKPNDVTDLVLTHAHHDHAVNFTLFPKATVWIGDDELSWAIRQAPGFNPLPELYARELSISDRVRRIRNGENFLPGFEAIAAPGHTPGHLIFYFTANNKPLLFTGDAAKNRSELMSRHVDSTLDDTQSRQSLEIIWQYWRTVPGTVLIPGHDLSMRLDENGRPEYIGERRAAIEAWFSETVETTVIDLCCEGRFGPGYREPT